MSSFKESLKKGFLVVLLGLAVVYAIQLWHKAKGVHLGKVWELPDKAKSPGVTNAALSPDLFLGPYRYLGKGRQCYIFESLDGRYVLKLLRVHRCLVPFWAKYTLLPERFRQKMINGRKKYLAFVLESFRIASREFSEGTAVFYDHFSATSDLPSPCTFYDGLGRPHAIDLNRTGFLLQEKKPLMMPQLLQALKGRNREEAAQILDAFLELLSARARLGLLNKDHSFAKNFSYENGTVIQIDVGSLFRRPEMSFPETYELSMREGTKRIRQWLLHTDEELLKGFDARLEQLMTSNAQRVSAK